MSDPPFTNGKMPFDFGEEEKMKPEMEILWVPPQQRQRRVWWWSSIQESWRRQRNSRNQRGIIDIPHVWICLIFHSSVFQHTTNVQMGHQNWAFLSFPWVWTGLCTGGTCVAAVGGVCETWLVCKRSCCGACAIHIDPHMHACVSAMSLFSTNFIGFWGADWSHLRLCCIFSDIPVLQAHSLIPLS